MKTARVTNKQEVLDLYLNPHITVTDIAAQHGVTRARINQIVKDVDPHAVDKRNANLENVRTARAQADRLKKSVASAGRTCAVCDTPIRYLRGGQSLDAQHLTCSKECAHTWTLIRFHLCTHCFTEHRRQNAAARVKALRRNRATGEINPQHLQRMQEIANGATDVDSQGRWFIEGSAPFNAVVDCVERGYRPVIDALNGRQRDQVTAEIARRNTAAQQRVAVDHAG